MKLIQLFSSFVPLRLAYALEHILSSEKISRVANVLNMLKRCILFFFFQFNCKELIQTNFMNF